MAYLTLTSRPLALDSRTVKFIAPLVSVRLASVTDRVGEGSSSVIVPMPRLSEIVAPEALERLRS